MEWRDTVSPMRKMGCIAGLLAIASAGLWGQTTVPVHNDGAYVVYGGVKAAALAKTVAAVLPPGVTLSGEKHVSTISLVVGLDGVAANLVLVGIPKSPLDEAAVAAVKQSQFVPGTLTGKPVPVQAFVWVPFLDAAHPAIPVTGALDAVKGMTPPRPVNHVEAQFSDEARRKHAGGKVLIAMMVTEEGLPADVQVLAPAGMGLDEEALIAARKYRFKPATLEGVPVPVPIVLEINFKFTGPQFQ